MKRNIHKRSARAVATLTKPGRHSDGGGLYLFISKDNKTLRRRFARASASDVWVAEPSPIWLRVPRSR